MSTQPVVSACAETQKKDAKKAAVTKNLNITTSNKKKDLFLSKKNVT
jgi:hypothetical protein